ncbi:ArnT family glycosyltransferase, partial [Candidatus Omnitrophota bacterium]
SLFSETYRPPLFQLVVGLGSCLCRVVSMNCMIMSNVIFMLGLLFSMYLIGRKVGGIACGLLAAFILSMLPGIFAFSRVPMPEFLLVTVVTMTYMFILYTETLTKMRYSILLGITIGCGMLTKITYPAFVALPLLMLLIKTGRIYYSDTKQRTIIMINLFLVVIVTSVIALWWYKAHIYELTNLMPEQIFSDRNTNSASWFYIVAFALRQMYPFFYILFNLMVIGLLMEGRVNSVVKLLVNMIVPVLIICIAIAEEARFTIAILPFAALLIAQGLVVLRNKIVIIMVVIIALFQCVSLSFYENSIFRVMDISIFNKINMQMNNRTRDNGLLHAAHDDWSAAKKICDIVKKDIDENKGRKSSIFFMDNLEKVFYGVWYLIFVTDLNCDITKFSEGVEWATPSSLEEYQKTFLKARILVIIATENYDDPYVKSEMKPLNYKRWQETRELFLKHKNNYVLLEEFTSGADVVHVYRKK